MPSPPGCPCCHKSHSKTAAQVGAGCQTVGKETPNTNGNQPWSFQTLTRGSKAAPCCPLPKGLGALRKTPRVLPSPVHPGGRLHQATVSGSFQDAKCHTAGPLASVTPAGTWDLNPRIHVLTPAAGRSAQEDGEWGLDTKGPESARGVLPFPGSTFSRPSGSAQLPEIQTHTMPQRGVQGEAKRGPKQASDKKSSKYQRSRHQARCPLVWTAGQSGLGDPSCRLAPGNPGTFAMLTLAHAMLGTRRNEGHLVSPWEAENGTPLGRPSPSAHSQRPWPKLPGDAGQPSINSGFSQQPRLLSQGLNHCPRAPLSPGSSAEPCCRLMSLRPAHLLGSCAAPCLWGHNAAVQPMWCQPQ